MYTEDDVPPGVLMGTFEAWTYKQLTPREQLGRSRRGRAVLRELQRLTVRALWDSARADGLPASAGEPGAVTIGLFARLDGEALAGEARARVRARNKNK